VSKPPQNPESRGRPLAAIVAAAAVFFCGQPHAQPREVLVESGVSASGSRWIIEMPAHWNGTLLLWSHGWWPALREPESAAPGTRERLLADGYALAASSYSAPGWALAEAIPDQLAVVAEFARRHDQPRRTLAWGNSMGGLVTTTLAERHGEVLDGALTMCASSGGAVGMMNAALDGAFAFVMLVAPDVGIRVVDTRDDAANAARVRAALGGALTDPAGRARVALASVLAGLPGWTQPGTPRPRAEDFEERARQMAASFPMGVFLPRAEQEMRAGGVFSWNTGVDYRAQLARSGRRALVEHMYAVAGLALDADLERLNAAPRISADPAAVAYMLENATPSGAIAVPVLSLHPIGDGLTSPSLQAGFIATVGNAGRGDLVAAAWNDRAGHCSSSSEEMLAALQALESRLETGRWATSADALNSRARTLGAAMPTFVEHSPAPLMRPCANRPGRCEGYSPGD
jgi:alpha-beta hydrolase superfamily lysophospholipase